MKENKGITLIALVITIIILIILAGISISIMMGEDGLITKAKMGAQNYQNAAVEEQRMLNNIGLYSELNGVTNGYGSNIATKEAEVITPGTENRTISGGTYLAGDQTILGDEDLVAGNIKSGVDIFGVTGTLSGLADINPNRNTNYYVDIYSILPIQGYKYISFKAECYATWNQGYRYQFKDINLNNIGDIQWLGGSSSLYSVDWCDYMEIPDGAAFVWVSQYNNANAETRSRFYYSLLTENSPYRPTV